MNQMKQIAESEFRTYSWEKKLMLNLLENIKEQEI
jgi:hypothetical protein